MPFTINNVLPYVAEQAHKNPDASSGSETDTTLLRWVLRAIRFMQRYDFECWREQWSCTLTAGTYQYNYTDTVWAGAALARPLRIDGNSIRLNATDQYLEWVPSIQRLDERLGGQWKDSGTANGSPTLATEMSQALIIGVKPSSTFVTNYSPLRGYYYRAEDLSSSGYRTTDLAMYDDFMEHLINLACVFAFQQTDDTEFRTQLQFWLERDLPEMRAYDHVPMDDEPIPAPAWAAYVDGAEDTF